MTRAELESKHLSELHTLADQANVPRYRMLSRSELIEKLADGQSKERGGQGGGRERNGGGQGAGERRPRERRPRERRPRGGRPQSERAANTERGGAGEKTPESKPAESPA